MSPPAKDPLNQLLSLEFVVVLYYAYPDDNNKEKRARLSKAKHTVIGPAEILESYHPSLAEPRVLKRLFKRQLDHFPLGGVFRQSMSGSSVRPATLEEARLYHFDHPGTDTLEVEMPTDHFGNQLRPQ